MIPLRFHLVREHSHKIVTFLSIVFIICCGILFIRFQKAPNIQDLTSIELYSINGEKYAEITNNVTQNYLSLESISPHIINAVIASEDQHFYRHHGFDYLRIIKALFDNFISGKKKYGASTITQQYARNLYLSFEKTYWRKLKEAYYALLLESNYSKDEILEGYLNTIYFGHGIYGIHDASYYYFGKPAAELSLKEAATIIAIIKAPTHYSPLTHYQQNQERANLILSLMKSQGKISDLEYQIAQKETVEPIGKRPSHTPLYAPYFQDQVLAELEKLNLLQDQFYRGLKVHTTLDLNLTKIIETRLTEINPSSKIEAAIYAIDPQNGYVKAMVGGRDYHNSQFNRAIHAVRHPGSTIKPLLYYRALEYGFTPATTLKSEPTTFYINREPYAPTNYLNQYPNQYISMAYALAISDNIYATKTHLFLGPGELVHTAKRFGVTTPMEPLPSLALGATEMRLSELTTAYAHFASLGQKVKPVYITKVTDMSDQVLYEYSPSKKQALDPDLCFIMNHMLTLMFDQGLSNEIRVTGHTLANQLTHHYSGKSGSTDYDHLMIGYNPYLVLGVWTGYDNHAPITNPREKILAKQLWANIMEDYFSEDYPFFNPTPYVVPVQIDPISGRLANVNTSNPRRIYFLRGTEPYK